MLVRMYEEKDLDFIVDLDEQTFSMPWGRESFQSSLKMDYNFCLILEDDGEKKGFLLISAVAGEGELIKISVVPNVQGKGYGKALLEKGLLIWKKQNVEIAFLEVRISNERAKRLYEKMGFSMVGVRKNYYHAPVEDAAIYQKEILDEKTT